MERRTGKKDHIQEEELDHVHVTQKTNVIDDDDDDDVVTSRVGGPHGDDDEKETMEVGFKNLEVPSWRKQVTLRSIVASGILSVVFNFIVCKLNLTTGVIPSLNVAAGLLGYALIKGYTSLLDKFGLLKHPFTRQENTVIQTCVVASSGIAFSSGTASYLLGMSARVAAQADAGNTPINVKNLHVGWIMGYLFLVSFVGLFSIVPLRQIMITKYKLTYPSGTATAQLINSLHTPKGAKLAKKQVVKLFQSFSFSFVFAFFQWFFAAADGCGFSNFPTFGLKAFARRFYFDFSSTYVGVGMICPAMVNISVLIGAIISWGIMWPIIETKKGIWYSADLSASSLHGIQGYRVFLAIALMLGDGLFQVVYMVGKTCYSYWKASRNPQNSDDEDKAVDFDEQIRTHYFLKDKIKNRYAIAGYLVLAALCTVTVPIWIFPQLKWYHIAIAYVIAPMLAFCNAYGCGLTDWSLASSYGKIAILIFSCWVGIGHGGVIAGLASCGVMMSIVSTASDLMQDFKTGYLTLASPRAMFCSQVIGTAFGCIMSPLVFWFFYKAYTVGDPTGSYPAPYGLMYRGIALLGVEGVSSLPKHCFNLAIGCFVAGIAINALKEGLKVLDEKYETTKWYKIHRFIPLPMAMAIPFYLGGYFAIDMCIGSLLIFLWGMKNKKAASEYGPAVASGLICGESLWGVPASILSLAGVKAPICMKFLSASDNTKVDGFLGS